MEDPVVWIVCDDDIFCSGCGKPAMIEQRYHLCGEQSMFVGGCGARATAVALIGEDIHGMLRFTSLPRVNLSGVLTPASNHLRDD